MMYAFLTSPDLIFAYKVFCIQKPLPAPLTLGPFSTFHFVQDSTAEMKMRRV